MKDYDKLLNIKTSKKFRYCSKKYFDSEATFYSDLVELFDNLKLTKDDTLVDLGSGLGRVLFLSNHLFENFAKGIELRRRVHKKSLRNLQSYNGNRNKIKIYKMNVLDYEIDSLDNYFFFFNSFSLDVLKEVVDKINESIKKDKRDVYIILAYPFVEYVEYFLEETDFQIAQIIEAGKSMYKRNKFLIFTK